ncbi:sulfite exporter TauE/SafE family protein [Corynebacterium anserum]|uniref:Probable membrane transporter protein n=1 Tax=Corynebacterium anserum TaxID=2684406 RepID=A0A7G7YMT2_9CORY|nr:sulfite exporter TauE/SafE family protein [Corynebacterium anserum]MBC2681179.1 TSUP family transporter [Corynebacterium anserum]QNH95802.1 TSUP family transporter [Corynebacterium anserum]
MNDALLIFAAFLAGSVLQRVSGMGLGLVAGPVMSLVLGPVEGILFLNVLATVNALLGTWTVRRSVPWRTVALLGSVMILGAAPAAWVILNISTAVLNIVVGILLLIALFIVTAGRTWIPPFQGRIPAITAGILAGFMNTVAGVAGPALTIYALGSRWKHAEYVAALQPLFAISGALAVIVKTVGSHVTLEGTPPGDWAAGFGAVALGVFLGIKLARMVDRAIARRIAIAVALAGASSVMFRGVLAVIG